jgi:hypothetical protein
MKRLGRQPENDHLDSLASYLCQLANQVEQAHEMSVGFSDGFSG